MHASLLPQYRGATPIETQILHDDLHRGVTIMSMDEELDHGPIVMQKEIQDPGFKYQESRVGASELRDTLAHEGGRLLAQAIPKWVTGEIQAMPQDHAGATFTKKIRKADGELDLSADPYQNFLKIQAFEASIGTYFFVKRNGTHVRVGIREAQYRDGKLVITRVVPEGKKEMSYEEFLRGLK